MKISTFLGTALGALLFTGVASAEVQVYSATLTGAQANPPNAVTQTATATFTYDTDAKTLSGTIDWKDQTFSEVPTGGLYTGACGVQGTLFRSATPVEDAGAPTMAEGHLSSTQTTALEDAEITALQGNELSAVLKTTDYPDGILRGQLHLEGTADPCGSADAGADSGSTSSGTDAGSDTTTGTGNNPTTTTDDSGCNTSGGASTGENALVALGLGLAVYGLSRRRKKA